MNKRTYRKSIPKKKEKKTLKKKKKRKRKCHALSKYFLHIIPLKVPKTETREILLISLHLH